MAIRGALIVPFAFLALVLAGGLRADEHDRYVREGNRLYAEGKYLDAEEKYILARDEKPDSAIARFNIGNTYHDREDYQRAIDHYLEALDYARADRDLEVRIRYNLATARVRESERSIGDVTSPDKLQTGIELLRQAMTGYRDILEIDPAHEDARHNLAVCQLRIKHLLDTLKKLREEAEKQKQDQEGKSPVEVLRELIAEEEEELGLSRRAEADAASAATLRAQLARVGSAAERAAALGGVEGAGNDAAREALHDDLEALEADPALVIGGAEISGARKAVEGGASGERELDEARARIEEAAVDAEKALRDGLESDRSKQEATRQKALGLVRGIEDLLAGEAPSGAPSPTAPGGQPPQPTPPPQPPPPEVAEALRRVNEHTRSAAGFMDAVLELLGAAVDADGDAAPAPTPPLADVIGGQESALEALRKALEEAEKLPQDEKQQQEQQPEQQGDEQQQDEKGDDKEDQGENEKKNEGDDQKQDGGQEGDEQEEQAREERKLSEEEAEELLRRFLRREHERQQDRRSRRLRGAGRGALDKDW